MEEFGNKKFVLKKTSSHRLSTKADVLTSEDLKIGRKSIKDFCITNFLTDNDYSPANFQKTRVVNNFKEKWRLSNPVNIKLKSNSSLFNEPKEQNSKSKKIKDNVNNFYYNFFCSQCNTKSGNAKSLIEEKDKIINQLILDKANLQDEIIELQRMLDITKTNSPVSKFNNSNLNYHFNKNKQQLKISNVKIIDKHSNVNDSLFKLNTEETVNSENKDYNLNGKNSYTDRSILLLNNSLEKYKSTELILDRLKRNKSKFSPNKASGSSCRSASRKFTYDNNLTTNTNFLNLNNQIDKSKKTLSICLQDDYETITSQVSSKFDLKQGLSFIKSRMVNILNFYSKGFNVK